MQGLASYGSDSEEELDTITIHTSAVPASSSYYSPIVVSNNSESTNNASTSTSTAPTPSLNRVKNTLTSTSKGHSPLSGVRLPPSNTASPSSRTPTINSTTSTTASPNQRGKQRASSASPPPYTNPVLDLQEESFKNEVSQTSLGSNGVKVLGASSLPIGVRLDSLAEFGIPEMVLGHCSPAVEAKMANFHHLAVTRGLHFNDSLSASKAFRNPRMYTTLVAYLGVNETDSGWDKSVWDPNGLNINATASRIAALQSARSEAKASQPAGSRSSIAFSSSSSNSTSNPSNHHNNNRADEQARIRDSMIRKNDTSSNSSSSANRDKGRERERERDRDRDREKDSGRSEKKSRWDTGSSNTKRERSRSPRRR